MKIILIAILIGFISGFVYGIAHTRNIFNIISMICIILAFIFIGYKIIKND